MSKYDWMNGLQGLASSLFFYIQGALHDAWPLFIAPLISVFVSRFAASLYDKFQTSKFYPQWLKK